LPARSPISASPRRVANVLGELDPETVFPRGHRSRVRHARPGTLRQAGGGDRALWKRCSAAGQPSWPAGGRGTMKIITVATERVRNLPTGPWHFDRPCRSFRRQTRREVRASTSRPGSVCTGTEVTDQRYVQARRWRAVEDGILVQAAGPGPGWECEILRDFEARKNALITPDGFPSPRGGGPAGVPPPAPRLGPRMAAVPRDGVVRQDELGRSARRSPRCSLSWSSTR